ncbi:IS481 family transposase [Gordonia sp. LUNF6]|uniref:IS481 family transposase n=1 Tax=Gordonia sp. LUNF6 TaxID=3388658 RepID=UPI00399BD292
MVRAVRDQHLTPTQAAARYRVSRQWVYELLKRYDREGPAGLVPRSRAPRHRPGTTPAVITDRIIALRRQLTAEGKDAGPETIGWHLHREGLQVPAASTIRRILHAAGLITPEPRKRPRSSYIRFEADLPNECWQADITHWYLAHGDRVEILDFLDDHSRFLLHISTQNAYTGTDVVTVMNALINQYGAPSSTLTDNGMVFTTRLTARNAGRNGFEKLLEAHHITQKNGSPGHPQTQGKIERFHQTLKRWLRARPRPTTIEDLQAHLNDFRTWYNTDRPHRSLGRRTPCQAYTALAKAHPQTTTEPEWRTRTDRIDNHGKVSLRYAGRLRHLGMGRANIGQPVLMLIHDHDVITTHAETGTIIATHHIDDTRDYQPPDKNTPTTREPPEKQ